MLLGQVIASNAGANSDARTAPKQMAILAVRKPIQKPAVTLTARVSRPSRLWLQSENKDQRECSK